MKIATRFLLVLLVGGALRASATEWRIVPLAKREALNIALPPLAVVESRDDSGKTWRLSGGHPVALLLHVRISSWHWKNKAGDWTR